MLPRTQRLHTAADFKRLRTKGKKWQSASFIALTIPGGSGALASRLGIIVSAKAGKAVVRKRLSRVLRAAFKEAVTSHPELKIDMVLIPRPYLRHKTSREVAEELRRLLQAGERK
jgi:ribonuclease P protein component